MTKENKQIETVTVSNTEFLDDDFRPPSSYYIKTAMGDYLFVKSRSRKEAQAVVDEMYGGNGISSKYKIRTVIKASVR